jgi:hypothetical protein
MMTQRNLVLVMLLLQLLLDPVLGLDTSLAQGRRRLSTEGADEPQMVVSITGDPNEGKLKYDTVAGTVGAMERGTQEGNIARHLQSDDEREDGAVDETNKNVEPAEAGDQSLPGESTSGAGDDNDSKDGAIGDDQGAISEPPERLTDESTAGVGDENDSEDGAIEDDQGAISEPPETLPNESVAGVGDENDSEESKDEQGSVSKDEEVPDDSEENKVEQGSVSKDKEDSDDSDESKVEQGSVSKDEEVPDDSEENKDSEEEETAELTFEDLSFDAISLTSCQKINFAVAYLTSLEFDGSLVANAKKSEAISAFWSDVYYLQMVVMPVSLMLAFFGSHLLFPASIMTAAAFGTFLVFHFGGDMNCKLKLGVSTVSAGISVAMAVKFVRFGLFTLGAVATGIGSYMFFDAFPFLDPGNNALASANDTAHDASYLVSVMSSSDISPLAWGITLVLALFTGICIKVYQQASVEVLTAVMGGVGIGYSMHSFILLHGGTLNRSIAFILAGFISVFGT